MIQQLINFLYRTPKAELKKFKRFGGYFNYRSMMVASLAMQKASASLPPVQSHADGFSIYFLTGKNYLYQTLFCIQSLVKSSTEKFKFILVDDGSFDEVLMERIKRQLPGAVIIDKETIDKNLQETLPVDSFPYLHHKRAVYPHIKKLTDIHTLPGDDWKLVLDSDMLFWAYPTDILNWLKHPDKPIHMIDCVESYGYTANLMEKLSASTIKPLINVGAVGLNSKHINWHNVEHWVKELETAEGTSYYLEQALTAMLIGHKPTIALDTDNYIVNPTDNAKGVLHHYVDLSKEYYYKSAWKKFI
ncbi:glycosyltransferase family 2 protein [Inquilinus sp. KBS0705]|nr:glycosyltransferase family 2 protein [Inquilinus sp. KBS0705]